jgi:glycosyltransferase involved in cell wall biosynthesis
MTTETLGIEPCKPTVVADVSVVIPTRDRPRQLAEAVASVLAQAHVEVEVIVVDDGSRAPAAVPADPRVRLVRRERADGPAVARNAGVAVATAPWVAFLDDDDLWVGDRLAAQVAATPAGGWSSTGALLVDAAGRVVRRFPAPAEARFRVRNALVAGCSSVLVARALLDAVGGFDESFAVLEDWELWIRLSDRQAVVPVAGESVAYRRAAGGRSHRAGLLDEAFAAIAARHGLVELDERWALLYRAEMHQRAGHRRAAAELFVRAARVSGERRSYLRAIVALLLPSAIGLRDLRARTLTRRSGR